MILPLDFDHVIDNLMSSSETWREFLDKLVSCDSDFYSLPGCCPVLRGNSLFVDDVVIAHVSKYTFSELMRELSQEFALRYL